MYYLIIQGTVIRQAFYKAFKSEIEIAYTAPNVVSSREMMSEEPLSDLLHKSIREMLGEKHKVEGTTDLFSLGMDSLQALRLRTTILSNLPIPANKLGMNIVFQFPSVSSLATELFLLQQGSASESVPVEKEMQQLIDRYGDSPSHKSRANSDTGDFVLGLTEELYSSIADNLTLLIHCAWTVNFALRLGSFEKDSIAGARNLMLLCLAARQPSPAKFTFCSSVSAVASTPAGHVPEAVPASLSHAQIMSLRGYVYNNNNNDNIIIIIIVEDLVSLGLEMNRIYIRVELKSIYKS
ncbi:hypothetical protein BHYA_0801g00010 [Botrytis hyacinthi]|uniref:Carrier domain-containing protein n=1 Tax=Botrytis hyacinthi TaxID=278943 RepID=A0A4Z1GB64_9HELO|nr:hypothetical protein BHYA_0801g00010 [Botrytis hyacinthi]